MSNNLAVINFSAGGSLTVSGKTTLGDALLSSNSGNFQGLITTQLNVTDILDGQTAKFINLDCDILTVYDGAYFFNDTPSCSIAPTRLSSLTNKNYVDKKATDIYSFIDASYNQLNTIISTNDTNIKDHLDASYNVLNNLISTNDTNINDHLDASYNELNTTISDTNTLLRTDISNNIGNLGQKDFMYLENVDIQTTAPSIRKLLNWNKIKLLIGRDPTLVVDTNTGYIRPQFSGLYNVTVAIDSPSCDNVFLQIMKSVDTSNFIEHARSSVVSGSNQKIIVSTVVSIDASIGEMITIFVNNNGSSTLTIPTKTSSLIVSFIRTYF
jgi:hypothetical protein